MKDLHEKLSIRTTDYVAIDSYFDSGVWNGVRDSVRGAVSFGVAAFQQPGVRNFGSVKDLDPDAFDKILVNYTDGLRVKDLIKAADHFGLVLVKNFPRDKKGFPFRGALKKNGIYEVWDLGNEKPGTIDLLFRVRKHMENV
jgi:hypothetical protein